MNLQKLSNEKQAWLRELFGVIDQMRAKDYAEFFEANGSFNFANHPPANGREAIAAIAQIVFDQLQNIQHQIVNAWETPHHVLVEGLVTYTKKSGPILHYPFFSVYELSTSNPSKIQNYRAYIDAAELFS